MAQHEFVMTLRIHPFDDGSPRAPDGAIYYPIELSLIREHFHALLHPAMQRPAVFNTEAPFLLRHISEFFSCIHDSHESAIGAHNAYRDTGTQYGVYLRSYNLGGTRLWSNDGNIWNGQDVFLTEDVNLRHTIADASPRAGPMIGFMNPHSPDVKFDGSDRPSISTLRVLNHNWQETVEQVVRGANWVVMGLDDESAGTTFELNLLRELNLNERTLVIANGGTDQDVSDFHRVLDSARLEELPDLMTALTHDVFLQTRDVADLSDFPCYIIDRHLDQGVGQFEHGSLIGARYEHFLPSSLSTNWNVLAEHFPRMFERWRQAEAMFAAGSSPGTAELASIMYQAVTSFVASTTIERYREISISIAIIGAAHRAITREGGFMADCYAQAAQYAGWSEEPESADYYRETAAKIRSD
jgi:hypothetical protein